jgi:hypothetical protein
MFNLKTEEKAEQKQTQRLKEARGENIEHKM